MTSEELDDIRDLIFDISKSPSLDREGVEEVVRSLRALMNAYAGATRRLYKLRMKLRDER